jgi:hypothetical protein
MSFDLHYVVVAMASPDAGIAEYKRPYARQAWGA